MAKDNSHDGYKLNRTGLIYDPLMLDYYCLFDPIYPEKPDRIKKPFERCQFYGLTEKCIKIEGRPSTDEEVEKCHTARVNKLMKESQNMSDDELTKLSSLFDSTFFHQKTDKAARFALGSSIKLMDEIMTGNIDNGFAIIRPPGHHAMHDEPNGYCYFNNASIVAKLAIEKYNLERVLIIDWDVHHGQGTQFQFYDDPRVLYYSLHRYDYGKFWPNLRESDFDFIGEKEGKGYNINIPLNDIGFGNSEYSAAFFNILYPIAYEYKPQLIVISSGYDSAIGCFEFRPQLLITSCGFDSAIGDEKGRMKVTPAAYAHFINQLSSFAGSKLCVLLEGGYCIKSLSEGVALSIRSLLGYPCPRIESFDEPDPIFVKTLLNLISVLRPYWKCLQGLNGVDTSQTLSEYLSKWDETYRKDVKFFDLKNKPETYPITGFYPLYSDDENERLDKVIDDLIASTDLSVPHRKTILASVYDYDEFKGHERLEADEIIHSISEKKFTNGLTILDADRTFIDWFKSTPSSAIDKSTRFKKVLNLAFASEDLKLHDASDDESVLNIVLGDSQSDVTTKYRQTMKFDDEAGYLAALLKLILPISYHFNPDLVLIWIDSKSLSKSSLILFEQYVRMLSSLANGNLVLNLIDNDSNLDKHAAKRLLSILNHEACSILPKLVASESSRKTIFEKMESLKSQWECFRFNDSIPKSE